MCVFICTRCVRNKDNNNNNSRNHCLHTSKILFVIVRVCSILITMHNNFTCMLLSIYMPDNNYSMSSVRPEFSDTLDCIESLFNTIDCNAQICCGDYNVSFQIESLTPKILYSHVQTSS